MARLASHLSHQAARVPPCLALIVVLLSGCSINLGSLTSSSSSEPEPAKLTSQSNIASLSETIKNNPNDPQAYNMRGAVLAQAGKTDEALADFNKAISLDANYGQAYANRGLVYRQTRHLDQAMADYERALALDAKVGPAHELLGSVLMAKGDLAGAIRELETALNLNPASGRAHYELGAALSQSGDNARAIEHFKIAARDVDPNIRAAAAEMLRRIGQR